MQGKNKGKKLSYLQTLALNLAIFFLHCLINWNKTTSVRFFSGQTVYITLETHTLRHGQCIVEPLYPRLNWIKKNSR